MGANNKESRVEKCMQQMLDGKGLDMHVVMKSKPDGNYPFDFICGVPQESIANILLAEINRSM